jgi:shikimate 5-dehydrogenase
MMATALAENGAARVYILGRNEEKLRETAEKYQRYRTSIPSLHPISYPKYLAKVPIELAHRLQCRFWLSRN